MAAQYFVNHSLHSAHVKHKSKYKLFFCDWLIENWLTVLTLLFLMFFYPQMKTTFCSYSNRFLINRVWFLISRNKWAVRFHHSWTSSRPMSCLRRSTPPTGSLRASKTSSIPMGSPATENLILVSICKQTKSYYYYLPISGGFGSAHQDDTKYLTKDHHTKQPSQAKAVATTNTKIRRSEEKDVKGDIQVSPSEIECAIGNHG